MADPRNGGPLPSESTSSSKSFNILVSQSTCTVCSALKMKINSENKALLLTG